MRHPGVHLSCSRNFMGTDLILHLGVSYIYYNINLKFYFNLFNPITVRNHNCCVFPRTFTKGQRKVVRPAPYTDTESAIGRIMPVPLTQIFYLNSPYTIWPHYALIGRLGSPNCPLVCVLMSSLSSFNCTNSRVTVSACGLARS